MRRLLIAVALVAAALCAAQAQGPLPGWSGTPSPRLAQTRGVPPLMRFPTANEAIPLATYQYINTCAPAECFQGERPVRGLTAARDHPRK
jgi:hypothetical protein